MSRRVVVKSNLLSQTILVSTSSQWHPSLNTHALQLIVITNNMTRKITDSMIQCYQLVTNVVQQETVQVLSINTATCDELSSSHLGQ